MLLSERNEKIERMKLRVLKFLSEPNIVEDGGAVKEEISRGLSEERERGATAISTEGLLSQMKEAGLIGRVEEPLPHDGKSKPYFITDAGREHLEAAKVKAMSTETGQRQDWAAREVDPGVQGTVADFIRRLPEFQTRSEERVQKVSQELAARLSQSLNLPR